MPKEVSPRRWCVVCLSAGLSVFGCGKSELATAAEQDRPRGRDRDRQPAPRPTQDSAPPGAASAVANQQVVARVRGREITMQQLQQPLVESFGLTVLLSLVQLELARDEARQAGVTVTPQDVAAERERTLAKLFPDAQKSDYEGLFDQFLQQQRLTRPEFDIVLQTNAHLRKVVEPNVRGRVTEANLEEAFRQTYGETVQVRHVQVANMAEIVEVKRRLAAGEAFEQVAQAMSRNPRTAPLGGELPPFSRAAANYPEAFRDAAFTLDNPGDVSDPVQADGSFHLIKLDRRIKPKAVEFANVKESLRVDLEDKLIQAGINQLRNRLGQEALKSLKIEEPTLREQYARKLENRDQQLREGNQVREELNERLRQRQRELEQQAATQPATAPATVAPDTSTAPATQPNEPGAPAPPATQPATGTTQP